MKKIAKTWISIREAANRAQRMGLINLKYYALSQDQFSQLKRLALHTKWRPTRSQEAKGWTWLYSFHAALRKYRQSGIDEQREKAHELYDRVKALRAAQRQREAIEAARVAMDAYEELGDPEKVYQLRHMIHDMTQYVHRRFGRRSRIGMGPRKMLPVPSSRDVRRKKKR